MGERAFEGQRFSDIGDEKVVMRVFVLGFGFLDERFGKIDAGIGDVFG